MAATAEIAVSFDTTGSMAACIDTVRENLDQNIERVLQEHPTARIAILAHGDYCDADTTYVTKLQDFTSDVTTLKEFVQSVEDTFGGDADECYELVLRKVRTELSWSPGSKRAYVLIGDCGPHAPDYSENVDHIDWRQEIKELTAMGVTGYAVHCTEDSNCTEDSRWTDDDEYETVSSDSDVGEEGAAIDFGSVEDEDAEMYRTLASQTGGVYLRLSDLANISDLLVAICKHQQGPVHLEDYENEVRAREAGELNADLSAAFNFLRLHHQQ